MQGPVRSFLLAVALTSMPAIAGKSVDMSEPPNEAAAAAFVKKETGHTNLDFVLYGGSPTKPRLPSASGEVNRIGVLSTSVGLEHDAMVRDRIDGGYNFVGFKAGTTGLADTPWQTAVADALGEIAAEGLRLTGFEVAPLTEVVASPSVPALGWDTLSDRNGVIRWWQFRRPATGAGISPYTLAVADPPTGLGVVKAKKELQGAVGALEGPIQALGVDAVLTLDASIVLERVNAPGKKGDHMQVYVRDVYGVVIAPTKKGPAVVWSAQYPKGGADRGLSSKADGLYVGTVDGVFAAEGVEIPYQTLQPQLEQVLRYVWTAMAWDLAVELGG